METIKATVINVMEGLGGKKETGGAQADLQSLLKNALAKKELRHIKFNYFKKGILGIRVDSSAWLYSLDLKKEKLRALLNQNPGIQVKGIRFHIGEIR